MFRQEIFQGYQAEIPDLWLKRGNPWEITRFDVKYPVRFYGEAVNVCFQYSICIISHIIILIIASDTDVCLTICHLLFRTLGMEEK